MCIFTYFFFFLWKYYFYLNILNLYISYIFLHFGDWLQYTKTLTSPTTIIMRIKYWKIYIYILSAHTGWPSSKRTVAQNLAFWRIIFFLNFCGNDRFYTTLFLWLILSIITVFLHLCIYHFVFLYTGLEFSLEIEFFSEYTYVKYIILNHHHFWWKLIELFAAKFYIHTKKSIFWYIKNQKVAQEGKKVVF